MAPRGLAPSWIHLPSSASSFAGCRVAKMSATMYFSTTSDTVTLRPSGDREERVHAPVRGSVRILDEARLAHRAVRGDERGHLVGAAVLARERDLRIDEGARAPDCGLQVAARAAVEVHARPEAFVDLFRLGEIGQPRVEECLLVRSRSGDRTTRARGVAAHAGIAGVEAEAATAAEELRRGHLDLGKKQGSDRACQCQRCYKPSFHVQFLLIQQVKFRASLLSEFLSLLVGKN